MYRFYLALATALMLSACGDSGDRNPGQEDGVSEPATGPGSGAPGTNLAPSELQVNLTSFAFNEDKSEVLVEMQSLDSTPLQVAYSRNENLDVPGFRAYSLQEDYLDRLFIALGAESPDGDVRVAVASDGGQFNKIQQGGFYTREGKFDPPKIGDGPGQGQVSYAGEYAGITNQTYGLGPELLKIPAGTDLSEIPDLPGQPAQVTGTMFLNANFADNSVNGELYNRVFINPITGGETDLGGFALILTDIDENGEFIGNAEVSGETGNVKGRYGGVFGGEDAAFAGGLVTLSGHLDLPGDGPEIEIGVFLLTQCGQEGDAAICDGVAPD